MCGIAGIFESRAQGTAVGELVRRMTDSLEHRGPDDDGIYTDGNLGLGMRRLSIIDLEGGHQPISNEDRNVVVVCNGEIYNYRELAKELRARGHVFKTASDTEVIVHLYEEYGDECVHHLQGMFAFSVWDVRRRRLLIARDRLGIKPLYYALPGGNLVFASEIKALLQYPGVDAAADLEAISNFLSIKYVPAPQTMFAGIRSLPPGHTLTWDHNESHIQPYWDLSFQVDQEKETSEENEIEQLDQRLRDAVRMRLRSDVPFGAFLSGGVDSSTIVAMMSEMLDEPVKTFSVGFEGTDAHADELPYARLIAKQFRTDHHEVIMGPRHLPELTEKVIWHLDQPIADQATLAAFSVSELAARHVKMVLSGEGGDELFAGYARYSGERLSPLFRLLPRQLRSLALATSSRLPGLYRPKLALYALCQSDEVARFTNWFPLFNRDAKAALIAKDREWTNGASAEAVFGAHLAHTDATHPLNRMLYVDTKLWLPDFLLLRGDKLGMANSLEVRVPFLDHRLVEYAASLPPRLKLKRTIRKYLLKKVSERYIPPEIIHRKKQGFPIPIGDWFRKEARSFVRDILSPATIQRRGLFNPAHVTRLLDEHEARFADRTMMLWGLINIELWHRIFVDSPTYTAVPQHSSLSVVAVSEASSP